MLLDTRDPQIVTAPPRIPQGPPGDGTGPTTNGRNRSNPGGTWARRARARRASAPSTTTVRAARRRSTGRDPRGPSRASMVARAATAPTRRHCVRQRATGGGRDRYRDQVPRACRDPLRQRRGPCARGPATRPDGHARSRGRAEQRSRHGIASRADDRRDAGRHRTGAHATRLGEDRARSLPRTRGQGL